MNIASISGVLGNAGQANYSASKAGVIGLTKSAAREFAAKNIHVNAVAPGFIETDMTAVLSDSVRDEIAKKISLRRMGSAEDVAGVVEFLCGEASSYVTGTVIPVTGGLI